jgi:hypothetical protein
MLHVRDCVLRFRCLSMLIPFAERSDPLTPSVNLRRRSQFSEENDGRTSEYALAGGFLARRTTPSVSSVSDGVCRPSWALLGCGTTVSGTRQMKAPDRDDVRLGLDTALPFQYLRRQKLAQNGRLRGVEVTSASDLGRVKT